MNYSFVSLRYPFMVMVLLLNAVLPLSGTAQNFNPDRDPGQLDINPRDVIIWEASHAEVIEPGTIEILLRLNTRQDFTLYQEKMSFATLPGFYINIKSTPKATPIIDPMSGETKSVYAGGEFILSINGPKDFNEEFFPLSITYIGCTTKICLFPYTEHLNLKVLSRIKTVPVDSEPNSSIVQETSSPSNKIAKALVPQTDQSASTSGQKLQDLSDLESTFAAKVKEGSLSLGLLLIICFLAGIATNITPCVYPMIPITIRLLSKKGEKPFHNAASYAGGILVSYSIFGLIAGLSGQMFGALMASPVVNFFLAVLMFLMGATMVGFLDFSALQSFGSKLGSGPASKRNYFFMGTGAGLVASPCTGPILAALLVNAFQVGNIFRSTLLIFVYSLGFSLPYLFLGHASSRLSKLKLGRHLQIGVEIVFTSVLCGLGFYYLRIPAYEFLKNIEAPWLQIAGITLFLGALIIIFILKSSHIYKQRMLLIPCILIGFSIFSTYLSRSQESRTHYQKTSFTVYRSENEALKAAKEKNLPLLIDTWAEWCEACKKMDATTFQDEFVNKLFSEERWLLAKIDLTESNETNDAFTEKYEIQGLPTLIMMGPDGDLKKRKVIAGYTSAHTLLDEMQQFQKEAQP